MQKTKQETNIEERKEQVIQSIANQLRHSQFSIEFKVVKKPNGIKIIHEVTREEMDALMQAAKDRKGGKE